MRIEIAFDEKVNITFDGRVNMCQEVVLSREDSKRLASLLMSGSSAEFETED